MQLNFPDVICVVYTGFDVTPEKMVENVQTRFGLHIKWPNLRFEKLEKTHLVVHSNYPRFTLLRQSIGSIFLAQEALSRFVPDIFIDTVGYSFALAFVSSVCKIPTVAYVHYPTLSADMYNQKHIGLLQRLYWRAFGVLYKLSSLRIDRVYANSTWTRDHIKDMWGSSVSSRMKILYPPCHISPLMKIDIEQPRDRVILYISQFRKEKGHLNLLDAFHIFHNRVTTTENDNAHLSDVKLVLLGSTRGEEDRNYVEEIRRKAESLNLNGKVDLVVDVEWSVVKEWLSRAWVGANAMWNEHFGIGIVEYMASGVIPVVHKSGGPYLDIVQPVNNKPTGFHATTPAEFADKFEEVFRASFEDTNAMRSRARESSQRFKEETFIIEWVHDMDRLLVLEDKMRLERISRTQRA